METLEKQYNIPYAFEAGLSVRNVYRTVTEEHEVICMRLFVNNEKVGEIVLKLLKDGSTMEIDSLYIEKEHRCQGHGSKLLTVAEETALKRNVERVIIHPYSIEEDYMSDSDLKRYYMKRGFIPFRCKMVKPVNDRKMPHGIRGKN